MGRQAYGEIYRWDRFSGTGSGRRGLGGQVLKLSKIPEKLIFQMTNNFWMDGAAFINQCPILPHQQFTYSWKAENAGTFWYHTHSRALKK